MVKGISKKCQTKPLGLNGFGGLFSCDYGQILWQKCRGKISSSRLRLAADRNHEGYD